MARFNARNRSTEVVQADQGALWAALTDPDLLPVLTPYLHSIEADGDRWRWNMARIPVLGISVAPSFTERMTFEEPRRIGFTHDPESDQEKAGVEGTYLLEEVDGRHPPHASTSTSASTCPCRPCHAAPWSGPCVE